MTGERYLREFNGVQALLDKLVGQTVAKIEWLDDTEEGIVRVSTAAGSSVTICGNDLGAWIDGEQLIVKE
jgi:hypothetical protein